MATGMGHAISSTSSEAGIPISLEIPLSTYAKEANRCAALMYLDLVPYQTRHSGASLGRVSGMRISYEVHRRGLWKSSKAVARYERTGRAQEAWQRIPPKLQHYMLECERRLTDIMVHGRPVPFVGL